MAWNIGANDVANSMASAVGAKAITIRQAILIAGILNVIGATFIGAHVTQTIRKGIVSTDILQDPHVALIGSSCSGTLGQFCDLEILARFYDPFYCRGHDRFWNYGRRFFSHQLGQTRCCCLKLGYFTGFQLDHGLFYVKNNYQNYSFQKRCLHQGSEIIAIFYHMGVE